MSHKERLKAALDIERRAASLAAYYDGIYGTREERNVAVANVDALIEELAE